MLKRSVYIIWSRAVGSRESNYIFIGFSENDKAKESPFVSRKTVATEVSDFQQTAHLSWHGQPGLGRRPRLSLHVALLEWVLQPSLLRAYINCNKLCSPL